MSEHEFNLIPPGYRERHLRRRGLLRYAATSAAILLGLGATSMTLGYATRHTEARIGELQAQQSISDGQRAQLVDLSEQRDRLAGEWQLLQGLRGGNHADEIVRLVGNTIVPGEVWLTDLRMRRVGVVNEDEDDPVAAARALVDVDSSEVLRWSAVTAIAARGQALNHAMLSGLAERMLSVPAIDSVHVERASLGELRVNGERVVDFELAITLRSPLES
ncbi:MAG: hypothetical protein AAF515_14930 [Pseudomonadota bacterium]